MTAAATSLIRVIITIFFNWQKIASLTVSEATASLPLLHRLEIGFVLTIREKLKLCRAWKSCGKSQN